MTQKINIKRKDTATIGVCNYMKFEIQRNSIVEKINCKQAWTAFKSSNI